MIKKEDATRGEDNKRKYEGRFMRTTSQSSQKKRNTRKIHDAPTPPHKHCNMKKLLCNHCNRHHKCHYFFCNKCNKKGHTENFCRNPTSTKANQGMSIGLGTGGGKDCYECGENGHFKRNRPRLKNQEVKLEPDQS